MKFDLPIPRNGDENPGKRVVIFGAEPQSRYHEGPVAVNALHQLVKNEVYAQKTPDSLETSKALLASVPIILAPRIKSAARNDGCAEVVMDETEMSTLDTALRVYAQSTQHEVAMARGLPALDSVFARVVEGALARVMAEELATELQKINEAYKPVVPAASRQPGF